MLDWLRRDPREEPVIEVAGKALTLQIRRNDRARRLTMRLAADGQAVLVTLPRWTPSQEALAFARSRIDWLEQQVGRIPAPQPIGDGSQFPFRGTLVILRHDPLVGRRVWLDDGDVLIGGPPENLAPRLSRWLKSEAQTLVAHDLDHYCDRAGHAVPDLSLSGAQRRWGSCSAKGVVRINWRLIMAPDLIRRSVVAHEVAHLSHFDHSPRFKAHLADIFEGDVAEADDWLRREGRGLYAHFG
ncbi:MAG: hypothetical protein RLZZ136_756 [Pseudomonadota bacterium]|jgi:predicted metal-dependent hydrolase